MGRAIFIGVFSAGLLGLTSSLIVWMLGRTRVNRRALLAMTIGLVLLYHVVAGVASQYGGVPVWFEDLLFKTIVVPWSYGFGHGVAAYWGVLAAQALVAALISAGGCLLLISKGKAE